VRAATVRGRAVAARGTLADRLGPMVRPHGGTRGGRRPWGLDRDGGGHGAQLAGLGGVCSLPVHHEHNRIALFVT
jgi:hypothetical protein